MANAIREINKTHSDIVAVIGDGHILGVSKELVDLNPEIIRLREVRNMKIPTTKAKPDSTSEVTFSYYYTDKK